MTRQGASREGRDDGWTPMSAGARAFRLVQVAIYVGISMGMVWWAQTAQWGHGPSSALPYLMSVYMAARAVSIFLKYRQDSRPPRYGFDYINALDLDPRDGPSPTPSNGKAPQTSGDDPSGSSHG